MPHLVWVLGLVVTFAAGVAAGGALWYEPSAVREVEVEALRASVSRLQRQVTTLRAELRAREARPAAAQQGATAGEAVPPLPPLPPRAEAAAPQANPAVTTAVVEERRRPDAGAQADSPRARPSPAAVAAPPPTVEAALQRFYRYLEENRQAGGPGYGGRQLLDDLRSMGPAGAEALLRVLANGTSSDERSAAAALLGSLQEKRALPMLQHIVEHDSDLMLRRAAARGLRRLGTPEAIPVLETLMSKPYEDRFVRLSAAYGLAELGAPHGVTGLAQIFDESNADGRGRDVAFRALASLDDERSLAFMRRLVTSPSEPSYRLRAIRFVATHGDQEALGALRRVMESSTEQAAIREAAAHAHAALTGAR